MNIFYLHPKPSRCARWHCDKHVVKMILETAQLLYTAHWFTEMAVGRIPSFATAPMNGGGIRGYFSIHNPNHPSAIWTRESLEHYEWLCLLGFELCLEFRRRFGGKAHSCEAHMLWLYRNRPAEMRARGWKEPPQAMPAEYKVVGNAVRAYRKYYLGGKTALLKYTGRGVPHWIRATASVKN